MAMRFDFAILGANADGLSLAASLARSGSVVAVLEPSMKAGGELLTESFLTSHRFDLDGGWILGGIPRAPVSKRFGPGAPQPMHPEVPFAYLFSDQRPLCFYRDAERTLDALPRRDRRGLARLLQAGEALFDDMLARLSTRPAPTRNSQHDKLLTATVRQTLDHYGLHDKRLRCALTYLPMALGHGISSPGAGAALAYLAHGLTRMTVVDGGIGLLANRLSDDIVRHGGLIFESARVDGIVPDGDRIGEIRLADGRVIRAAHYVSAGKSSALDTGQQPSSRSNAEAHPGIMSLFLDFSTSPAGFAVSPTDSGDVNRAYMVGFGFEQEDAIYRYLDAIRWTQPPLAAGHLINNQIRDTANPSGALGDLSGPLWCASCHTTEPRDLRRQARVLMQDNGTRATGGDPHTSATRELTDESTPTGKARIRPVPASAIWQAVMPHGIRAIDPEGFRQSFEQACIDGICERLDGISPSDVRFRLTWLPAETGQSLIDPELVRLIRGDMPGYGSARFVNAHINAAYRLARYTGLRTADALIAHVADRTQ